MHVEDGVYRAAGADFSRGGSKGQLAFGVTYLLPQALPAGSDSRQALAHHQGVSERIKALFISTNPPPRPRPTLAFHRCLEDGAGVRHKNAQAHSLSCACPCWLSPRRSCPTGQLTLTPPGPVPGAV